MSSENLRTYQTTTQPAQREHLKEFPKTTAVFDWLVYVGHRLEEFVWESKRLIFGTAFLIFLVYELAHFAKFLLKNWTG